MTLETLSPHERGVVLAAPPQLCLPCLTAGAHVQMLAKTDRCTIVDAQGVRLVLAYDLAAQIIVVKHMI